MTTRIALIPCGKQKLATPALAKDLYTSVLFKKSRAFAEMHYDQWFILSALHQVLVPEQVVVPYDVRMPSRRKDQELWGHQAAGKLSGLIPKDSTIDFFAGDDYGHIVHGLSRMGFEVRSPISGLQVGERLQWLNTHLQQGVPLGLVA